MHRKKLLAFMLIAATAVTAMPAGAFADTVTGDIREITEADLDENNQKDVSIPVEYTVGASFTVKLPSAITLSNTDGSWGYSGTVGVKGDIESGTIVKVTPAKSITMYDITNRPTNDIPANADDQAYDHKNAKSVTVAQTKQQWGMTEINTETYSNTDLTLTAGAMQSGKWCGTLPVNIQYGDQQCLNGTHHYKESIAQEATCTNNGEKILTCSVCGDTKTEEITGGHLDMDSDGICDRCGENPYVLGETYTMGNWTWIVAENNEGYNVLQATSGDRGLWPGYLSSSFGNGSTYNSDIDGKNISECRSSLSTLYNKVKSAEYSEADYGTGLYLISMDMAQPSYENGYYNKALKDAANNAIGSGGNFAWLGTVDAPVKAWTVDYDGEVHANGTQRTSKFVIAPAFNLDPTKVTLNGNAIIVK